MRIIKPNFLDFQNDPIHQDIDKQRFKNLIKFMHYPLTPILDIGSQNFFGVRLARYYGVAINNTSGDLNSLSWRPEGSSRSYNTVWIFEVIEHLVNPAQFLNSLSNYITSNTEIYMAYPYRTDVRFWPQGHWHEMDERRFRALAKYCNYRIVKFQKRTLHRKLSFYLRGIRPLLRLFFYPHRHNYYELRLK